MAAGQIPKWRLVEGQSTSKNPGVLVIENKWRYFCNRTKGEAGNRVLYFHCKKKNSSKCKASAVLIEVEKDGEVKLALAKWIPDGQDAKEHGEEAEEDENLHEDEEERTLETHHNHMVQEADEIVQEMRKEFNKYQVEHPETLPDSCRRIVFLKYESMFIPDNAPLWDDIVAGLGQKSAIQRNIRRHRTAATGKRVLNRDDFDYQPFLSTVPGGEKVKTIDSNNPDHLPEGWKEKVDKMKDMQGDVLDAYKTPNPNRPNLRNPMQPDNPNQSKNKDPPPSKRILIFTTFLLLELCRFSKWSLDGTFKACPVLWGQLMIVMAKVGPFWIPVSYGLLPDKEKDTYFTFLLMMTHYIENVLKLKFEVEKVILDYELSLAQAVSRVWGVILKGCLFHFSQAIWKFCQTHQMAVLYSRNQEFRDFVKMVMALAHVPLKDLDETMQKLRNFKFKSAWRLEGEREEKQKLLLDYVQNWWIDGPFPPSVWNVYNRHCDFTNNNQESHNAWFINMLGEKHGNPHAVLGGIVKALTMAETTYREWKRSVPKKENVKVKAVNEMRESHKKKYNMLDRIEYLKGMGNILKKMHETIKNNKRKNNTSEVEKDQSHFEDPLDGTVTEDEEENNPFKDRVVGKTKRVQERVNKRPVYSKKNCAGCGKGFNSKSKFKICHLCDKLEHNLCIKGGVKDDTRFACSKCRPNSDIQSDQEDIQIQSIDDAVAVFVQNSARGIETEREDLGRALDSNNRTEDESATEDDERDDDLDMPKHIVDRRNEALKRGREKRQKNAEENYENEQESILNKSDHNVNPEESEDDTESNGSEDEIRKISQELTDPRTKDDVMLSLLQRLENIQMSTRLIMTSSIGRVIRHLRDRPERIGNLATSLVKEWKLIVSKEADDEDDEDEDLNDQEETDSSGEQDDKSVNITPPPKYPKEAINNRKFKCNKCEESFIHQAFLNAHVRSKHSSLNETERIPDEATNKNKLNCEQCEFQTEYKANLQRHIEKKHKRRKDTDEVDDEDDEREDQEENSVVDDSNQSKFNCEQCTFKSEYKANLVRHEEKQHKKRKATAEAQVNKPSKQPRTFQCEECSYKCGYKFNLKKHVARIH